MLSRDKIEEFRRKLRQGQEVRVVGGQVVMANEPDPPPQHLADPATPQPGGVHVKPHQWGAKPFYATKLGEQRAMKELTLLTQHYPGFVMDVDDDGTPYAHGWIGPHDKLRGRYHVLVALPPGFGSGVMPVAYLLEPQLRGGAPHIYQDGGLCLDHSGAFTARSTLVTFLAWVSVWLVLYEGWLETGEPW